MTRRISLDIGDKLRAAANVPLFAGLSQQDLLDVAAPAHLLTFSDREVIVPEGEHGLGFYVILSGAARVLNDGDEIVRLETGDFFGEIALIERPRLSASVVEGSTSRSGAFATARVPTPIGL